MKKTNKINNLKFGLFTGRLNLHYHISYLFKDIKIYFKRRRFVLKHGYSEPALWETFEWFIVVMKEILYNYRHHNSGYPATMSEEEWYGILDHMLELLDKMSDEYYFDQEKEEWDKDEEFKKEQAKNEFFELFSKYFYNLWD